MTKKQALYASSKVWDAHWQAGQKNLVQAIVDFFPKGVDSLLDVGCGDGKLTKVIAETLSMTTFRGLDISEEALSRCDFPTDLGSADHLPYEDSLFDCVMSTDMLEHLSDDIVQAAVSEMFRVAGKWVILSVPYRENLLLGMTRCKACGNPFHVNWHQRRYTHNEIDTLIPKGWGVRAIVLSGEKWVRMHPVEIMFRRAVLGEWSGWENAVCPECGSPSMDPEIMKPLDREVARLLGKIVYQMPRDQWPYFAHSEMLLVASRVEEGTDEIRCDRPVRCMDSGPMQASLGSTETGSTDLLPFPQAARSVVGSEGETIYQFPLYGEVSAIDIMLSNESDSARVRVEDGAGLLVDVELTAKTDFTLSFPRIAEAGYYGLIVRCSGDALVSEIKVGDSPAGLFLEPAEPDGYGYHPITYSGERKMFLHVTEPIWLDVPSLAASDGWTIDSVARGPMDLAIKLMRDCLIDGMAALKKEDLARRNHFDEIQTIASMLTRVASTESELESSVQALRKELNALVGRFNRSGT
ncbi:MAG: class I SAM-dependent methyltransferase [Pseudomonadales bacterium]